MKYAEKLRDPRWQKRRLEVLERDEFACQWCSDDASTLAVHHLYYVKGKDPWDYPLDAYLTLCEACHKADRQEREEVERNLLDSLKRARLHSGDLEDLTELFLCVKENLPFYRDVEMFISALGWMADDKNIVNRFIARYLRSIQGPAKTEKKR